MQLCIVQSFKVSIILLKCFFSFSVAILRSSALQKDILVSGWKSALLKSEKSYLPEIIPQSVKRSKKKRSATSGINSTRT